MSFLGQRRKIAGCHRETEVVRLSESWVTMAGELRTHQEAETSFEASLHDLGAVTIIPWSNLLTSQPFSARTGADYTNFTHPYRSLEEET